MLTKKEKVISSILCVISVLLLIASLCFTTLLFTTHGTVMNAEAGPDIDRFRYEEYFSESIYPNGYGFTFDETYFAPYNSNLGGYSGQIDFDVNTYEHLFRLDVAYRCRVVMSAGTNEYEETAVFFPSAYNTDGTLYYGFCFMVDVCYVRFQFMEAYIKVDILCPSNYSIDTFFLYDVPSLTPSSFYSSYETVGISDGLGSYSTDYTNSGSIDFFHSERMFPYLDFNYPCFLLIDSNVGPLLVYYNPLIGDIDLACFRLVGIPNNFYTYCSYDDSFSKECFAVLHNDTFDFEFVFEYNDVYLVAPVPLNQAPAEDDPSINESLGEVLLQGMTFGFDSIGEGITYTFNNLFLDEEGKLSTFTYVIVFTLGIGIVLGFIKWLLSYILSLGGKD